MRNILTLRSMVQTGQIDIKAFEDSFRKLFRPLCMYAMHYVRDADVAEDIVEECFVRLLQRGFPEGGRITSYIHASVRNQAIDYLRKNKSVRILPEDEEGLISDEEAFGASCEESRIWEALERLPLRRRQIFIMSRRDGMSHEEIAKELGISVRTVKNQISRALAAFDRKKFTKFLTFFF